MLDEKGEVAEINPALASILRLSPADLAAGAHRARQYVAADGSALALSDLPSARAVREARAVHDVEMAVVLASGERIWVSVSAAPLPTASSSAVVVVGDITQRVEARQALVRTKLALERSATELSRALEREQGFARTDFLTGLANRRQFYDVATHELAVAQRYGQPLAIVLFDLDHFKEVNDRLGHAAGDEVLREIAGVTQRAVREADLVARHGGEEFVILLPRSDARAAAIAAEHVREEVAKVQIGEPGDALRVTVSAGVVEARPDESVDSLVHRADGALYAAKAAGRNRVVVA